MKKCCGNCLNLKFFECPSPHFWCDKNSNCPCNGDEVTDTEFSCNLYIVNPDLFILNWGVRNER